MKALKDLEPKEQTKAIKDQSSDKNNQSIISNIFNDLIKKIKIAMNELYESADMSKLYFDYKGLTKGVRLDEYYDFKELFNKIKNNQLSFDQALKNQNNQKQLLKKINEVIIGRKTPEQEEVVINLEKLYNSRGKVINFFKRLC